MLEGVFREITRVGVLRSEAFLTSPCCTDGLDIAEISAACLAVVINDPELFDASVGAIEFTGGVFALATIVTFC
jgi:hypothetical protein